MKKLGWLQLAAFELTMPTTGLFWFFHPGPHVIDKRKKVIVDSLKNLNDNELIQKIQRAVEDERKATTFVLHCLREMETRRLFLSRGFSSLHDYCVRGLGYSEAAAFRRISAMRLLKELPEVEQKIETGELSLSTVSSAQSVFQAKKKAEAPLSIQEKQVVLSQLAHKSRREAERVLSAVSPETFKREVVRDLNSTDTRISVTVSKDLESKLEKLKSLKSHCLKDQTVLSLLEWMVDDCLKRHDPEMKETRVSTRETPLKSVIVSPPPAEVKPIRHIPAQVKREVWLRDKGQCRFPKCTSRTFLDYDHIRPDSLGGQSDAWNLRLLCRAHNQFEARRRLGAAVPKLSSACRETCEVLESTSSRASQLLTNNQLQV